MPMAMHDCKQCQLPNEFSALGQLEYLRKSESMSGHVPVLFMQHFDFIQQRWSGSPNLLGLSPSSKLCKQVPIS